MEFIEGPSKATPDSSSATDWMAPRRKQKRAWSGELTFYSNLTGFFPFTYNCPFNSLKSSSFILLACSPTSFHVVYAQGLKLEEAVLGSPAGMALFRLQHPVKRSLIQN